ncbi:Protein DMSR-6 [Aphelenchoides avenae]|nr:Protein DMSR-6 [Aphelenchus avenae]
MECGQVESLLRLTDDDNAVVTILEAVAALSNYYASVHQTLALLLCLLGVTTNAFHLAVLTPREMRRNAVNRLLIFVAVCDIGTMFLYSIFVFRFGSPEALTNPPVGFEFGWAAFLLFYSVTSVALHSITLYSVVAAAYIRYSSIRTLSNKWRHHNVSRTLTSICVAVAVLCIPTVCLHSVEHVFPPSGRMRALYRINLSGLGPLPACTLFKVNLWLSGIFFKVLPCALMLTFTISLLRTLSRSKRRRIVLLADVKRTGSVGTMSPKDRTTRILVVLLSAFLVTELPQGLIAVVNAVFPHEIHWYFYLNFGELLDLMSLVNCNTCFVVYAVASPRYRASLAKVLRNLADSIRRATTLRNPKVSLCSARTELLPSK